MSRIGRTEESLQLNKGLFFRAGADCSMCSSTGDRLLTGSHTGDARVLGRGTCLDLARRLAVAITPADPLRRFDGEESELSVLGGGPPANDSPGEAFDLEFTSDL
jgi:hypothetical protein